MPDLSKIALSDKELLMVQDGDWILTKHRIIEKVFTQFAAMVPEINRLFNGLQLLPGEVRGSLPKISKGEQYLGLPYVILDYPRVFDHCDVYALRTMFWWGNFFSITLHVSGKYKATIEHIFTAATAPYQELFLGINENPWHHHFGETNYRPWQQYSTRERLSVFRELNAVKIALKFGLTDWNNISKSLIEGYTTMADLLATNCQGGEKDPLPGIPRAGSDP